MSELKRLREAAGLSVRELAARAGTSHSTIIAYEKGRKIPRSDTRDRLIAAAGWTTCATTVRRVRFNTYGTRRDQELQDVLRLADALQDAKRISKPRLATGPRGEMPVFPPRLGP